MVKTKIKIRRATEKDIPQLFELWKKFVEYHVELSPFYEKKVKNAHKIWVRYIKTKMLDKQNCVIFVAVKNDKIIGYATARVKKNKPIFKLKRYGRFGPFFVLSGYRGKGIGSMLKNKVFSWFKSKGLKHVEIGVLAVNKKTKKIYKHWGFKDYVIEMRQRL